MGDIQNLQDVSLEPLDQPGVYATRWYVITMVSLANAFNNLFWASWGPISQSTKLVYGWTNKRLFWAINASNITACILTMPAAYLIDRKGIRVATVTCVIFMTLTSLCRYITITQPAATILLVLGQCFNGAATSITMVIPPTVAEVWFPVHERTTATAIVSLSAVLGVAGAFVVGPQVVSMPTLNGTSILLNETNVKEIKNQMKDYNCATFWLTLAICLLCIVYLPAKPKTAPSLTAQLSRYMFLDGLKFLIRKPAVWLIGITFAIPNGFFGNWLSMLDAILNPRVTQEQAGWMSFSGSIGGIIMGLITARFVDKFKHTMKTIIVLIYIVSGALIIFFTLISENVIHVSIGWIYGVVILVNSCISSIMPLFIDITVEISYPIAEGVASGFLVLMITLGAALALGLTQIQALGTRWMNWCVCGGFGLAPILLLMFLKPNYQKVDKDDEEEIINEIDEKGHTNKATE